MRMDFLNVNELYKKKTHTHKHFKRKEMNFHAIIAFS